MSHLPITTTKHELVEAHKAKMFLKAQRRARGRQNPFTLPSANLSRRHPDYGQPLIIHLANKEQRNNV